MRAQTIDIDGPVFYEEYAGPSEPPPFVLVHGLGGSHVNWRSLAPLLAKRARVLVVDLAGHGRTPLGSRSASIGENRALLDRFVEQVVGDAVVLVGNSMGGAISILQAAERPETVAGLVLIDPALPRSPGQAVDRYVAGLFATYMIPRVGEAFLTRRVGSLGPERIARDTLAMCTVDPSRVDPAVVELQIELARERAATMPWATTAFLQAARSLVRTLTRRKWFMGRIAEVSAPTLMVMGRQDRLVPIAAAESVARARPDWHFVILEDCGHVPQLEFPNETFAAISSWLDGPARRLLGARAAP